MKKMKGVVHYLKNKKGSSGCGGVKRRKKTPKTYTTCEAQSV